MAQDRSKRKVNSPFTLIRLSQKKKILCVSVGQNLGQLVSRFRTESLVGLTVVQLCDVTVSEVQKMIRQALLRNWLVCMSSMLEIKAFVLIVSTCPRRASELPSSVAEDQDLLQSLYPVSEPYEEGKLQVDSLHTLHFQLHGNPHGIPALFLHGGPGAGCNPNHARFFDPSLYSVVLLDQRGSGKSVPRGDVRNNTLQHLVQDCEELRLALGIDQWKVVLGGSWGSTLAVAYAQEYPGRIASLILRGICLLRPAEVDWLFSSEGGAAQADAAGWNEFQSFVDMDASIKTATTLTARTALHAYYDLLLGQDPIRRIAAAQAWMRWEGRVSSLHQRQTPSLATYSPVIVQQYCDSQYQDPWGCAIDTTKSSAKHLQRLRKGLASSIPCIEQTQTRMRGLRQLEPKESSRISHENATNYIPAQQMLTCYYSVNERYATNHWDPLHPERMQQIQSIPCIAVHGGRDSICPVDTALELSEAWPSMELRIPVQGGHSMYNNAIRHELVQATNRFAKNFLSDEIKF